MITDSPSTDPRPKYINQVYFSKYPGVLELWKLRSSLFEHFIHFIINLFTQMERYVPVLLFEYIDNDVGNHIVYP